MTKHDTVRYEMLVRVREFGEAHRDAFPEASVGGHAFAVVSAAASQLGQFAVSRIAAARETHRSKAALRSALLEQVFTIERTARLVAEGKSGFDAGFQVPRRTSDHAVLAAGKAFAQNAGPLVRDFVAHGLPDTFLADLKGQLDAFEQSLRRRDSARNDQIAAMAGVERAMNAGLAAARRLDILIANQYRYDSVTLTVWKENRRVGHWRGRKTGSTAGADATGTTAPLLKLAS